MARKRQAAKVPKTYTRRSAVTSFTRRTSEEFDAKASTVGQKWLMAAAEVIAVQARANASKFSTRIAPATHVTAGDHEGEAIVITDGNKAPNALPFEYGERHPLFGDREYWYPMKKKRYLARAVAAKSEAALEVYAKSIDEIAAADGWDE